jgi:hypothetical protein
MAHTMVLMSDIYLPSLSVRRARFASGLSLRGALSGWRAFTRHGSLSGKMRSSPYGGFRLLARIIQHLARLYHHGLSLSLHDVELILGARGIVVSYASIRVLGLCFDRMVPGTLKRVGRGEAINGSGMRCISTRWQGLTPRSCPGSSIAKADSSIIGLKRHISRRDRESGRCND